MDTKVRIEMVHLQLTRKCNLNCWFCGQRKNSLGTKQSINSLMLWEDWEKVIHSLMDYRSKTNINPSIMLWGGEPLLFRDFEKIVSYIHMQGFPLGMVTNGTLLEKHIELCKEAFKVIYISVDGSEPIHDAIRGKGTYRKIHENMSKLKGGPKLINMAVLTPEVRNRLDWFLDGFLPLEPDQVILQEMIGLQKVEVEHYKKWLYSKFEQQAFNIDAWEGQIDYEPSRQKKECLSQMARLKYPFEVTYLPHGIEASNEYCLSPFRHIHITWNGNVTFCTDFTDFSAGNVKENDILDIFENQISDMFRQEIKNGNCITCNHCSWKNSQNFHL